MPAAMTPKHDHGDGDEARGALATASPTRRQNDWPSARPTWPTFGTLGQKIHRPKTTRAAGRTTSAKVAATTTPTAQARPEATGRREEREQQGEQAEHDGGRAGEHGLGGATRAMAIASRRSCVIRSSSR